MPIIVSIHVIEKTKFCIVHKNLVWISPDNPLLGCANESMA